MLSRNSSITPASFTSFGALLRYLRQRAQLTHAELARAVGCSATEIAGLEQHQFLPDLYARADRFVLALNLEHEPAWADQLRELARAQPTASQEIPPTAPQHDRPADPAAPAAPLLITKLYVPPARPNMVIRPRLLARLNSALVGKLTLISAPAGFGKTTLLSAWLASRSFESSVLRAELRESNATQNSELKTQNFKVAWVSLDAGDNDPTRFWGHMLAALDSLHPGLAVSAQLLLQSPQPPTIEALLTTVLNALSARSTLQHSLGPDVLVLDDYHLIDTSAIHQALTTLVDYLPPHLHLVIATRADPPLPLARWRARGALTELRADDLRFTPDEAATFLMDVMGLPLSTADVAALEQRTEGWIAGLQLAALAMQNRSDLASFISAFTGSNRFVMDYLAEEVFGRQPAHIQAFLLRTSILERMCGSLCDAVMLGELPDSQHGGSRKQQAYSQVLLEELERANIFTNALDDQRRWYRYHHLFAEVLRERLHSGATSADSATLHRRASRWYEQHGLVAEAVRHALAAEDWERAAELVERVAETMWSRGEYTTLQGWFEAFPEEVLRSQWRLNLFRAWTYVSTNQLEAAERCVQLAEAGISGETPVVVRESILGEAAVIRAGISLFRNEKPRTVELAQHALKLLPADALRLRGQATFYLGMGHPVTDLEAMLQAFAEASRLSEVAGDIQTALYATFQQAAIYSSQGQVRQAATTYQQALTMVAAHGAQHMPVTGWVYMDLGELWYEQNDLEAARLHLKEAIQRGEQGKAPRLLALSLVHMARVLQAQADRAGAFEAIRQAEELVRIHDLAARYASPVAAWKVRLWLAQGNIAAAAAWAQGSGLSIHDELAYASESGHIALARVLSAQGRGHQANELLERLRQAAEGARRMADVIEILAVQALAQQAAQPDDPRRAFDTLEQALVLAEQQGNIRKLADEGEPMRRLLSAFRSRRAVSPPHLQAFVDRLLAAFPGAEVAPSAPQSPPPSPPSPAPLIEPLTARELEVLRLVAAGGSDRQIAERLVVAIGTVKRHLNNLYGKLGVRSRTQALARARELGLL